MTTFELSESVSHPMSNAFRSPLAWLAKVMPILSDWKVLERVKPCALSTCSCFRNVKQLYGFLLFPLLPCVIKINVSEVVNHALQCCFQKDLTKPTLRSVYLQHEYWLNGTTMTRRANAPSLNGVCKHVQRHDDRRDACRRKWVARVWIAARRDDRDGQSQRRVRFSSPAVFFQRSRESVLRSFTRASWVRFLAGYGSAWAEWEWARHDTSKSGERNAHGQRARGRRRNLWLGMCERVRLRSGWSLV